MNCHVSGFIDSQDGFGARDRSLEHQVVENQVEGVDRVLTDPLASEPAIGEPQGEAQGHQTTTAQSSESMQGAGGCLCG